MRERGPVPGLLRCPESKDSPGYFCGFVLLVIWTDTLLLSAFLSRPWSPFASEPPEVEVRFRSCSAHARCLGLAF